jgi:heat shock protein HslJ
MKNSWFIITALVLVALPICGCSLKATSVTPVVSEISATVAPVITIPASTPTEQGLPTMTSSPTIATQPGFEGTTWQLVSYVDAAGDQRTPLATTHPTAKFENNQVGGNASCNSYFASYQVNGDKLTVGNAGSTMMACGDPGVMIQESAYLGALQNAASFQIKDDRLEIADMLGKVILVFTEDLGAAQAPAPTLSPNSPAKAASLSLESLTNTDFRSGFTSSGRAPLSNGGYSEPGAQGSAAQTAIRLLEPVAYGELPDGQVAAAVALATETGGSGTFYELALVVDMNGAPLNIASVFLGDRIKLNSIKFENGQVLLDMVKQGPDDPMCCPTQHVLQKYVLQGAELVLVSTEEIK